MVLYTTISRTGPRASSSRALAGSNYLLPLSDVRNGATGNLISEKQKACKLLLGGDNSFHQSRGIATHM